MQTPPTCISKEKHIVRLIWILVLFGILIGVLAVFFNSWQILLALALVVALAWKAVNSFQYYCQSLQEGLHQLQTRCQQFEQDLEQQRIEDAYWKKNMFVVNAASAFMTLINQDYVFEVANDAYLNAHKKKRDDIVGKTITAVWGHEIFEMVIKPNIDACFAGEIIQYKSCFEFGNLGLRHMEVIYTPYRDSHKHVTHVTVITHDITDLVIAEENMRKARDDAEKANTTKGRFLANMSHEIRTPINGIVGATDLLADGELDDEEQEYIEIIRVSSDILLRVINDILDFSKMEAGKLELEVTRFLINDLMGETMRSFKLRAAGKELALRCVVAPDTPQLLLGDPGRLRQILTNLMGNALKFTHKGEILVRVDVMEALSHQVKLRFTVKDTGIGIANDKVSKLFKSFSQVDSSDSRRYGGTGLGLAICKQLVAMMGGDIWVQSTEGVGSLFCFSAYFPLTVTEDLDQCDNTIELHQYSVLVIDDDKQHMQRLDAWFKAWGLQVTLADNGNHALTVLAAKAKEKAPFHLVVLDPNLKDMDGFKLLDSIKKNRLNKHTSVMILTSSGFRGDATLCRKLGVSAYFPKPVTQPLILAAMQRIFSKEAFDSESLVTQYSLKKQFERGNAATEQQDAFVPTSLPKPVSNTHKGMTILLAEDNIVNQKVVVAILEKKGHSVIVAENGKLALEILERQTIDCVLMDMRMPEMDGITATRLLRQREQAKTQSHVTVIALTANAMQESFDLCMEAGMDGYIAKPINAKKLIETMDEVLCRIEASDRR